MLPEQLAWIATRSDRVREIWAKAGVDPLNITSLADFKARAPFMDKDEIRAFPDRTGDPFGGVLCVPREELTNIGSSSSTTGDSTIFAERWERGYEGPFTPREYWMLGARAGDHILEMSTVMRGLGHRISRAAGAIPLMLNHDPNEVGAAVELIQKYRPTLFFHLSSPVIYGSERLEREQGIDMVDLFSSFRACVYRGEPIGPRMQQTLDRCGVKVFQFSSLGDSGTIWECGAHFVRHTRQPCRCGRTHVRLTPLGRLGDEVVVNGQSVLPRDVWTAVEHVEETAAGLFKIIRPQRELTALKLRVGYDGQPADLDNVARRVADEVQSRVGVRPSIELTPNSELIKLGPPHKIPRVSKV